MGVIDKVSVSGTTYDVQDTAARAGATIANDWFSTDAFGGSAASATLDSVSIVRAANRVTLNGTRTGETYYFVNCTAQNGVITSGNTTSGYSLDKFINPNAVLLAGRTYRIIATVVSGSYSKSQDFNNRESIALYSKDANGAYGLTWIAFELNSFVNTNGLRDAVIVLTPETDTAIGLGFVIRQYCTFTNFCVEFRVEDITNETYGINASGGTVTLTGRPGVRYNCINAYVSSLSFTPCARGVCSVRFVSGTTPTVLTLPNTVKMPDWWNGCEANRTYEISIEDGVFGVVTSWA